MRLGTVGAVAVPDGGLGPGGGVGTLEEVTNEREAEELDPEAVEAKAERGERTDDIEDLGGGLAAADGPQADGGADEIDADGVVVVDVTEVVVGCGALEDRDDREVRGVVTEVEEVLGGEALMVAYGEAGATKCRGLAHPVLGSGPDEAGE